MQRRSSGRLNKNRSGSDDRPASPAPRPALKSQKPSKSQPQPQSQSHSRTRSRKEEQLSKPDSNHHQPHHHQNNHQNSRYHSEFEDAMAEAGFTPRSPSPPRRHPRSPVGNTAKIALPVSDTPIIRRNQQFRQNAGGGGGNRRSSIGMRGRRASSLMDSGIVGMFGVVLPQV